MLGNARYYEGRLVWLMHTVEEREGGLWFCHVDDAAESGYIQQLASYRPNSRVRDGDQYQNWTSRTRADHYFDAEKMFLGLLDYAKDNFPASNWIADADFVKKRPTKLPTPKVKNNL